MGAGCSSWATQAECRIAIRARWREADGVFTEGMKMMAMIGFIMIAAAGFAEVMRATGAIGTLVDSSAAVIGDNRALAALLMLLVGLLITMGIGSSFSTIPIIAAICVPLAMQLGFSPAAIVALVGTAAALGDAGSPASDSTLGPTAGQDHRRRPQATEAHLSPCPPLMRPPRLEHA